MSKKSTFKKRFKEKLKEFKEKSKEKLKKFEGEICTVIFPIFFTVIMLFFLAKLNIFHIFFTFLYLVSFSEAAGFFVLSRLKKEEKEMWLCSFIVFGFVGALLFIISTLF